MNHKTDAGLVLPSVPSRFHIMQGRHWCFTINNWTVNDEDRLKRIEATYIVFGYETGESGTRHLQGYVCFAGVKRFGSVKTTIGQHAHIERMRGTPKQAADYCKKDGLFYEEGTVPLGKKGCSKFDSFVEWIVSRRDNGDPKPSEREVANAFPQLSVFHGRKLQKLIEHLYPEVRFDDEDDVDLREWQVALKESLLEPPPDKRSILFYVDEEGGKGKTFLQRHMLINHSDITQVLSVGKRDDIAHAIDPDKTVFLFNIPRGGMEYFNYTVIEQLKDRMVFSPKYDSRMKLLRKTPHVVVFCNESPDESKMSEDRYVIINI